MCCSDSAVVSFGTISKELTLYLKCKLFDTNIFIQLFHKSNITLCKQMGQVVVSSKVMPLN